MTAEQVAAAKAVLRESIADTLEAIIGRTMYLSQCDEADIRERAERNAEEIIA